MKVYLDTNVYNRLFNVPSQDRIRREAQAARIILRQARTGIVTLLSSPVIDLEVRLTGSDKLRNRLIYVTSSYGQEWAIPRPTVAQALIREGVKPRDAFHLSAAIAGGATHFLTCDDRLLRRARHILPKQGHANIVVQNPMDFVREGL